VKNDLNFNENLATFIGDIGAEKFLIYRFGKGSEELIEYQNFLSDRIIFKTFMLNQAESLKQFYAEIHDLPDADKIKQKEGELKKITEQSKLLSFKNPERYRWLTNPKELPNNTLFTDFLTYNSDNQKLDSLFYKNYNGNIAKMIEGLKEQYSK
jgi:predicted aminopeptidase